MSDRKPFYCDCVGWNSEDLFILEHLIGNRDDITLKDFRGRVDPEAWRELTASLGYGKTGLRIANDYHVNFAVDRESGIPFLIHSAIEYVFATQDDIDSLRDTLLDRQYEDSLSPG